MSNFIRNKNIYHGLASRGHNVTVFTPDIDKHVTKNVHYIRADGIYEVLDAMGPEMFDFFNEDLKSKVTVVAEMWEFAYIVTEMTFKSQGFKTLNSYPDDFKFDLVITDYTFGAPLLGFLDKFGNPPVVGVTAFSVPHYTYHYVGGHKQPSYVSHHMISYSTHMSLWERIWNYYVYFVENIYMKYVFYPKTDALMKEHFNKPNLPYIQDLGKQMSLALVNTHFAVETVEPLPMNVIPVAGLQIRDPQPLEKDVETFIKSSQKGTVLFSLGTNVKSSYLSQETKETIIRVFKDLPQYNFLWKYETDLNIPLPKNVKIQPWLKQSDILSHPNIKAFISHCGLLGTQEGTWWGVPIIGIPFFADQHKNLNGILHAEAGVKVNHKEITFDTLKSALLEVLENPKYYRNAKKRGALFRDQETKPLDRAIFWLEWAMRHKDRTEVIDSPVKNWGSLRRNGYDVLLCLVLFVLVLVKVTSCVIKSVILKVKSCKSCKDVRSNKTTKKND